MDGSTAARALAEGGDVAAALDGPALARAVGEPWWQFLPPLLRALARALAVRLVRPLATTVSARVRQRTRPRARLLSEVGAYRPGPPPAPAATKRRATLIHRPRWPAPVIDDGLREQGRPQVGREAARGPEGRALGILAGSVVETPERRQADGLTPVRSRKARRRRRPGPPLGPGDGRGKRGGPLVGPGWPWVGVLVAGWDALAGRRPLTLGAGPWSSTPRPAAAAGEASAAAADTAAAGGPRQREREAPPAVRARVVSAWGPAHLRQVWHRGLAGAGWLGACLDQGWQFVGRWQTGTTRRPADAPAGGTPPAGATQRAGDGRAAWRLTAGLRSWGARQSANPRHPPPPRTVRCAARPVRRRPRDQPLWLVVARRGQAPPRRRGSGKPGRRLTTAPVTTERDCWRIVAASVARWPVAQLLRFGKSALGIARMRVRDWQGRPKRLALGSLASAFRSHVLATATPRRRGPRRRGAHRTGRPTRAAASPLSRLPAARAALWHRPTPTFAGLSPSSSGGVMSGHRFPSPGP